MYPLIGVVVLPHRKHRRPNLAFSRDKQQDFSIHLATVLLRNRHQYYIRLL